MKKTFGNYTITLTKHTNGISLSKDGILFQYIQATAETSSSVFKRMVDKLDEYTQQLQYC